MNRPITARCGVASIDEPDGACSALRGPALATILGTYSDISKRVSGECVSGTIFVLAQFVAGVDVTEGVGFIVECDFDDMECRVPGVYFAPTALQKGFQVRQHRGLYEGEDGMRSITGFSHGEVGIRRQRRRMQSRLQIVG